MSHLPRNQMQDVLHIEGIFDIKTGQKHNHKAMRLQFPRYLAMFQINSTLFISAGLDITYDVVVYYYSLSLTGSLTDLAPMQYPRCNVSLSGHHQTVLAVGGFNNKALDICTQYNAKTNLWEELPPLNEERSWCGSTLLPSHRAFSFCGSGQEFNLSSV